MIDNFDNVPLLSGITTFLLISELFKISNDARLVIPYTA